MSEFISINYTRVVCNKCGSETIIEPGRSFSELNCTCRTETARQLREIKEYSSEDGTTVELVGEFDNGDLEIKYPDGSMSYRINSNDFSAQFKEAALSLGDLIGKTADEIKEEFPLAALRGLASSHKIKAAHKMRDDTLVARLIAMAGAHDGQDR